MRPIVLARGDENVEAAAAVLKTARMKPDCRDVRDGIEIEIEPWTLSRYLRCDGDLVRN